MSGSSVKELRKHHTGAQRVPQVHGRAHGKGARREIVSVEGKIRDGNKETFYNTPGFRTKDTDIDGAVVDSFAREVMWHYRLGPLDFWFPLTAELQKKYPFRLEGEENYRGFDAWRISCRDARHEHQTGGREEQLPEVRQRCLVPGHPRRRDEAPRAVSLQPDHRIQFHRFGISQDRRTKLSRI
jgi:hypothetical protein